MELRINLLGHLFGPVWILILCSACVYASSPSNVSDFSGALLIFETGTGDQALFKDVDWSDGATLVLQGWDISNARFPLYLANTKKSGTITPLFMDYEVVYGHNPTLSPGGEHLAFWDSSMEQVSILNIEKAPQTVGRLPKEFKGDIAWSADGQELSLIHLKAGGTVIIYVFDLKGELRRELEFSDPRFLSYKYGGNISWSPDGKQFAFSLVHKSGESNLQGDIFIVVPEVGHVIQLTDTPTWDETSVSWAPESERVTFVSTPIDGIPEINGRLTFANANGSCTKMTQYPLGITSVSWGPSANDVAVTAKEKVYILRVSSLGADFDGNSLTCYCRHH